MSLPCGKLVAVSGIAAALALLSPATALGETLTVTRGCADFADPECAVQVAPPSASAVAVAGPSTALGPAIELNLAASQVADAGSAVRASGSTPGAGGGVTQSSGVGSNSFEVSVGQNGTATATSGRAGSGPTGAQIGGASATQNVDQTPGGDQTGGGGTGGGGSGINMITTVASVVQIVQVVARNNTSTTIAPIQVVQQCQQAAVSCSGSPATGH